MPWLEWSTIAGAGFLAGMINVVVGSGTLVTFPVLLLFGYPPLVANISNTIGLVGGNLSGTFGYRAELRAQGRLARLLLPVSVTGGVVGALMLLVLPPGAFTAVVPVLVTLGLVMVLLGPVVQRRAAGRERAMTEITGRRLLAVVLGVLFLGAYGGYFGAAQGILIVGLMGLLTSESLQSLNGLKNLLVAGVNAVAAVTFVLVAPAAIDWVLVLLIAVGATLGGIVGARVGRRFSPALLRGVIVVVGGAALINMLLT